jgi:hypothetical protein
MGEFWWFLMFLTGDFINQFYCTVMHLCAFVGFDTMSNGCEIISLGDIKIYLVVDFFSLLLPSVFFASHI